jgi:hypothetical protein
MKKNDICKLWLKKHNLFQNLSDLSRKLNYVFVDYRRYPLSYDLLGRIDKLIMADTPKPQAETGLYPAMAKPGDPVLIN